jgi:hypothetical protein
MRSMVLILSIFGVLVSPALAFKIRGAAER